MSLGLLCAVADEKTPEEVRIETFEKIWQLVNDRYFDKSFNGVDWNQVKALYAPKVYAVKDSVEFYELMNKMLKELKQSHFAVIPPDSYIAEAEIVQRGGEGTAGITLYNLGGKAVAAQVDAGFPAEKSGLKPGYVVVKVNGKSAEEAIKKIKSAKYLQGYQDLIISKTLGSWFEGSIGSVIKVEYLDGGGKARTAKLKLIKCKGAPTKFGELPLIYADFTAKTLPGNIGYIKFNIFMMPLLEKIEGALQKFIKANVKGIIIDLRGNVGGIGVMTVPIASYLFNQECYLGTMKLRDGDVRFFVNPKSKSYSGKVAVLIDEGSASTSEIFAAGLQELKRAVIIGRPSAGAVLPSVFEKLPDGSRIQYVIADFRTPKGTLLEGVGVNPDVPVKLTRAMLLKGSDPFLTQAVKTIQSK